MNEESLQDLGVDLILAIMRSASTEKIRPVDWWKRAQGALYSGAAMGRSFGDMVAIMGKKVQVDVFSNASALAINDIGERLGEADFEAFRDLCERDALYLTAMAQAVAADRRERYAKRKEEKDEREKKAEKTLREIGL